MPYKDKQKQNKYLLDRLNRIRNSWLQENGPCGKCGSWKDLEVDHINPDKKECHKVWSWSNERRERELKKCQVLCYECHKIKTANERRKVGPVGTVWCNRCKKFLDKEKFSKDRSRWIGYCSKCKSCTRELKILRKNKFK